MARALGLPMAVAFGERLLEAVDGEDVVLDGDEGTLVLSPSARAREAATARERRAERRKHELAAARELPAVTRDGRAVGLLCNVSTPAEVAAALDAGAQGVGLLRTELAFLHAPSWPSDEQHYAALAPALAQLTGRVATVRTLDFGADKTPPFLRGVESRGVLLMLANAEQLAAQLRAILRAGARTRLRVLFPMVERVEQIRAVRTLLAQAVAEVGWSGERPQLGAMIETPAAAAAAPDLALEADFFSIGTNDLVQYTLGLDRELPVATALAAADPEVLSLVARTAAGGERAGIAVDVCGEAASEPALAALFIGLGVTELSVAPARVDEIRAVVRGLSAAEAAEVAQNALRAPNAQGALTLAAALVSGEVGDERDEALDGLGGTVA
jgi:phosphoenolpyruvate-protein kinase (PTS system EI component)